jgi:hypothetical protein
VILIIFAKLFLDYLDPLVEPKRPSLSYTPRAIKNIQLKLKALKPPPVVTVDSLYEAIHAIFEEHGTERTPRNPNTPESWFRFLPGPVRLVGDIASGSVTILFVI